MSHPDRPLHILTTKRKAKAAALERILFVAEQMSNACFNIGQWYRHTKPLRTLTARELKIMYDLSHAWDVARTEFAEVSKNEKRK